MSMPRDTAPPPPFLIGANLPWVHYGIDFGANAWRPEGGVAQPAARAQLEAAFRQPAAPRGGPRGASRTRTSVPSSSSPSHTAPRQGGVTRVGSCSATDARASD